VKIAFVNPPRLSRKRAIEAEDCCWGAGPLVLPSMLLSCASEAKRAGHEVAFLDLAIDGPECLHRFGPDVIVHPLAWQWWREVDKEMARWAGALGVARVAVSIPPGYARYYRKNIDDCFIIEGEPEATLAQIGRRGERGPMWLPSLIGNRLDELGPIDYSLVIPHYWPHYQAAGYQVTRGCPYRCTFCTWGGSTVTDTTFKMRTALQVADNIKELREIAGRYREKQLPLYLLAAQLTTSEQWIREFHAEMACDPYPFQSNVNLAEVTPEKIALLKGAGLVSCASGLDAVSDEVLSLMDKPYDFDTALDGLLVMRDSGLLRRVRVRYGMGETQDAVDESVRNLGRIKKAVGRKLRVAFAPIVHYEGTRVRDEAWYKLEPLPGDGPERLVMANPPDYTPFLDKLRELDWLGRVGPRK